MLVTISGARALLSKGEHCRPMGPPSNTDYGECVSWLWLLLAVSVLNCRIPPATAQTTIESVPFNVTEGKDVLLLVRNLPETTAGYIWYKGSSIESNQLIVSYVIRTQQITLGPAHSGRETVYPNGSLLLQKVTQEDTGHYTLQVVKTNLQSEKVTGEFHVYPALPKPFITSNKCNPMEHKDPVVLTCEPEILDTTYLWFINGYSLLGSAQLQLSKDNRTLTLLHVTRNDTGPYECETRNPVSVSRSDPFVVIVLYGPDTPTISPSDSFYCPGGVLSLFCHTASTPAAQYSWLIDGKPQKSTQELFIPNISSNNSGSYTCRVYNSATHLSQTTVKTIVVFGQVAKPSIQLSNTTVRENDTVVLTCLTNETGVSICWFFNEHSLKLTDRMKLSQDNNTLTIDPVRKEDAGYYQCEVSNPISFRKSDTLQLNVKSGGNSMGLSVGTIAGIVFWVLAGKALIVALGYF